MQFNFGNIDLNEAQQDFARVVEICSRTPCEKCELVGYKPLQLQNAVMFCETGKFKKYEGGTEEEKCEEQN